MRSYFSKSYSQQARFLGDRLFKLSLEEDSLTLEECELNAIDFLHHSYKHPKIRQRAAKRFGRKMRGLK